MKILALPHDNANPYQSLLYGEMRQQGVRVGYLGHATPSYMINLLLQPLELLVRRLAGARLIHLHWVYDFYIPGSARWPVLGRVAQTWFAVWLWTVRLLGYRLVWTAHNVLPYFPVFADDLRARRKLVASCDLVLVHSQSTLGQLAELGMVPRRAAVIPHGPFIADVAPESLRTPGSSTGPRRLLFLGKVRQYKGVDDLLAAFAALPPDTDARLIVAGDCSEPPLAAAITELARRTAERVEARLEHIPEAELSQLFAEADVVILPFRQITTSGSVMLALCHGRPVIIPDLPGLTHLPEGAVHRYDGTVEGLTGALADMIVADASVLAKMSAEAYAYCSSISWSEIGSATLNSMKHLLGNSRLCTVVLDARKGKQVREHRRIAVVLPVGPNDGTDALDTLASVLHYAGSSRIIVVVDDTGPQSVFADRARAMSPDIVVLPAPWRGSGKTLGGLFINITTGYQWLLERYAPDILLRLDVDALMTGPGLADTALDFFAKNPGVGVIGSYRIRADGEIRDWSWGARRIRTETGLRGMVHPAQRKLMRELVSLASANGYISGEHALGAGLIHSLAAADNLFARGWYQLPCLSTSRLGEDMIMGLLAVASGY